MKKIVFTLMAALLVGFVIETTPMAAFWVVVSGLLIWFILGVGFPALMSARSVIKRKIEIAGFFKYPLYLLLVLAWPADVIFNVFAGSWIFGYRWWQLELPREWTFTKRCERHKKYSMDWRRRKGEWWCDEMDKFAPEHC